MNIFTVLDKVLVIAANWKYESWGIIIENCREFASKAQKYGDGRVALVIGDSAKSGEDYGEIIIKNAKSIHIW